MRTFTDPSIDPTPRLAWACCGLISMLWGCSASVSPERAESASVVVTHPIESPPAEPSGPGALLSGLDDEPPAPDESTDVFGFPILFQDVHESAGITFLLDNGKAAGEKLMPEATTGGGGWFDLDRDGRPDLCFAQAGQFVTGSWNSEPQDEIYRNLGGGRFQNISRSSRIIDTGYGHGVSVADFNEDGFDDVYVSNVGEDHLFLNLGDGTLADVTRQAGITNPLWSTSAGWGDLDGDSDLDLYVCNYADYDPYDPIACMDSDGNPRTCHPRNVDGVANVCFFNQGDGSFMEEADARGLNGPGSLSLGVVIADFDRDGDKDVYVANDTEANHLFINESNGRFAEQALALGCSRSELGQAQASMGIAFGDYDGNGWQDLYVTHFTDDSNTLYQNLGPIGFTDATQDAELRTPTLDLLGFGAVMEDFNADGLQDLLIANGHIDDWRETNGDDWHMRPQLFRYDGDMWREIGPYSGDYFQQQFLGRAVGTADYDADGDLDVLVVHQNDEVALLENRSERGRWLQIRLIGTVSNRRGIGAVVTVEQGSTSWVSELAGGTSYCTSHQPIISVGLGTSDAPCRVTVDWPDGTQQVWEGISVDSMVTLMEGDPVLR